MEKNLKNLFLNKIFIVICVLIILFSFFSGFLGQVFSFKEISTGDRHGGTHTIKVPEAGDAVRVPAEVEQSYGTYEGYDRSDWSYTNKTIYEKWVEQGKPASDSHWAYLNINGKPRDLVAVVPTFGQTGDYIDIDLTCDGKSVTYPCIIADSKDIWVDSAYSYNGVVYGHTSNGKCNIIEVCSELSADSSNWSSLAPLLNKLTGVTQIANGGSMLDHPDGPVGLNGNYNYEDGTSSKDASADGDDEAESFNGAIAMIVRDAWDSISATFENNIRDRNDTSVLYDIKNLSRDGGSTGSKSVSGFVQYYQGDYSDVSYGDSNIGKCGCGPTAFAMVASTISKTEITPKDAVAWCGNSYYVSGAGTSWSYFAAAKEHFKLNCTLKETTSIDEVAEALKSGALVISSQSAGLFTSGGHFIVLAGIDSSGGITVRDPNKNNAVNKGYNDRKFTKSEINQAAKNYWIFTY